MANKTAQDAHERIVQASIGCLVDASDTYLEKLRVELYLWVARVNNELADRNRSTSPVFDMNKYLECPSCGAVAVERTKSTLRSKPDNYLCVNCGEYHGTSVSGPFAEGAR